MSNSGRMRFAISLFLIVLVSACLRAPRAEDVVGIWRAENGAQLELAADGTLLVEQFDPGCWDEWRPGQIVSGGGAWSIPERRSGTDPRTVRLNISDARVSTEILYGGDEGLMCVVGDPDAADYVHFLRVRAASP